MKFFFKYSFFLIAVVFTTSHISAYPFTQAFNEFYRVGSNNDIQQLASLKFESPLQTTDLTLYSSQATADLPYFKELTRCFITTIFSTPSPFIDCVTDGLIKIGKLYKSMKLLAAQQQYDPNTIEQLFLWSAIVINALERAPQSFEITEKEKQFSENLLAACLFSEQFFNQTLTAPPYCTLHLLKTPSIEGATIPTPMQRCIVNFFHETPDRYIPGIETLLLTGLSSFATNLLGPLVTCVTFGITCLKVKETIEAPLKTELKELKKNNAYNLKNLKNFAQETLEKCEQEVTKLENLLKKEQEDIADFRKHQEELKKLSDKLISDGKRTILMVASLAEASAQVIELYHEQGYTQKQKKHS